MVKKIVQDIVPAKRKSIKKVSIEPARKNIKIPLDAEKDFEPIPTKKTEIKRGNSVKNLIISIAVIISLVTIGIAASILYHKALIIVSPKSITFEVNGKFNAKKDSNSGDLNYEVISASHEITETVSASKGSIIQTKSKGIMTVFNNHSSSTQVLVAGTRISNQSGLVYRTTKTITVPGKKVKPGSIDVVVIADKVGTNHNLQASSTKVDFKLPGYVGSDKYNNFYARIKTDIVGGYYGSKIVISENIKNQKVKEIQDKLKDILMNKIREGVTDDYILYDNAYEIKYTVSDPVLKDSNKADIKVSGIINSAIFNRDSLMKNIAGTEVKRFPSNTYEIKGDKELIFNISNIKDFSVEKGNLMVFSLKGSVSITGIIDEKKLKDELKSSRLSDSNDIFAKHTAIKNARFIMTPFWMRSVPNNLEKIEIEYRK